MTWHQHTAQLARTLRMLVTSPATLNTADIPAFTQARTVIWHLVNDVHRGITTAADRVDVDTADFADATARDLVVELSGRRLSILSNQPPQLQPSATEAASSLPDLTTLGRAWAAAKRSARLARAAWEAADPADRPAGPATLPLLADITSLAWAVSRATTNSSPHWAGTIEPAARTAVLEHAATVAAVGAAGLVVLRRADRVNTYADFTHAAASRAVDVPSRADLAEGMRHEAVLLRRAGHLSPAMAAHIAIQHSWTTNRLGQALVRAGEHLDQAPLAAVGRRLIRHAAHLDIDVPRIGRVTTITRIDPTGWHAYRQARSLYGAAAGLDTRTLDKATVADLLHAAGHVPTVTTAIADMVNRHTSTQAWLARRPGSTRGEPAPWMATTVATQLPMRTQLLQARADAKQLTADLPRRTAPPPARTVLGQLARTRPGIVTPGPATWTPTR